jgi:hypothetical protein
MPAHQPDLLTTRVAAAYCGYNGPSALRKAYFDGKVMPIGRRGGTGTLVWRRADLDRFLAGMPIAPSAQVIDVLVHGAPRMGKSLLARTIAHARGVSLIGTLPSRRERECARLADVLVVDPFEPQNVTSAFVALLSERRRLGKPTIMTSPTPPMALRSSRSKCGLLAEIAKSAIFVEVA